MLCKKNRRFLSGDFVLLYKFNDLDLIAVRGALCKKRGDYNSKDIGSKSVVNAFLRGLIVTFFADN